MKQKSLSIFISIAVVIFLSSMALIKNLSLQDAAPYFQNNEELQKFINPDPGFCKGMITIKLKEGLGDFEFMQENVNIGIASLDEKFERFNIHTFEKRFSFNREKSRDDLPDLSRIYKITFSDDVSMRKIIKAFEDDPNVEYAEGIPVTYFCEIPNDEFFDMLYHLQLIEAEGAWDIHKGEDGPEVVIGIVDDAVDWRHNDLIDNQWENLGEDADGDGHVIEYNGMEWIFDFDDENGIDDDGNGKVDDFVGWDFINEFGQEDNDPTPNQLDIAHGTHCIGIANSRTNNLLFTASIAWNVKFVTAKCANEGDLQFDSDPWNALIYIAELGVDIITNSWTELESQANREVIEYAHALGCIIVAAAGNANDEYLYYPANYPGVVSVAATTMTDTRAGFSSYGIGIDVCAPGVNILSLKPNNLTRQASGTSMSCPLVAGQLALMKSYYPSWTNKMLIEQLVATADDIDNINPNYINKLGHGRINAHRALSEVNPVIQQELKLRVMETAYVDENDDGILEPAENVFVDFEIMNWSVGMDTVPVTFTLSSTSPHINIISNQLIAQVPSDDFMRFDSAFIVQVSPDIDSTRLIDLTIHASSTIPIPLENDWTFQILVNQRGVLVYNGIGTGNAYSGEYIRDFLIGEGLHVYYSEAFLSSLNGFDAVFLSFGNYGESMYDGTYISEEMASAIAEYLTSGGYLYEDCGSFFGLMEYYDYGILEEMVSLCGVDSFETPMTGNSIDTLRGLSSSLAEGLVYNGSTQTPSYYIDIMTPNSSAMAMFEEQDYGVVAVQGEGEFGQKTVCFSYAIAHLEDGTTGTRDQLLAQIAEFFGLLSVNLEEPIETANDLHISIYPNPAKDKINIDAFGHELDMIRIYSINGKLVFADNLAGEQLDISKLKPGIYIVEIQVQDTFVRKKLLVE